MTEVVITNDAPSGCSDAADVPTCAVPMCVNSVPPSERPCKLHQCNYGQPSCDCTPPALASFVAFPSELEDRARWIRLIGREDLVSGEAEGKRSICSLHFPDAEPTEANPDPLLNLSPTLKLDLQNDDLEVSVPAFIIVEDKHDNKLGSQDETEDSPKSNDGGTSLAVTTQSSPTLDPQSIDEMNLKKSDSQDDDLKANTSMPVTMEDSYENQPALEVEVETSSKGDDAETSLVVTSKTTNEPIPQSKNEMTSKKVNLKTSRFSPAKVKKSKTVVTPRKPVVRESRQRRAASRKDYSEFSKESSTSSESESSDSEGDTGSDSDSDSDSDGRVYCKCGQPNTDDMIGCDGKHCEHEWFHFKCVGINPKKVPRGKWFCETCQVKQEDSAWSSKLKQVCREIMAKSITLQSASQAYGISVATLSKRLNSNPILTTQEENRLVEMAVNMCKQGHWPMVKESVLNSVKVLLDVEEKMGIKRLHPFTKNLPPDDWWHAFCRRHPKIRQLKRQHQASQSAQASQVENSSDVKKSKREGVNGETPSSANAISKSYKKGSSETKQLSNQAQKLGLKRKKLSLEKSHQNQSLDTSSKKDHAAASEGSLNGKDARPNAFQCLEAIIVKKQRHAFQRQFKSGDESEKDPLYSAWRALRCLYGDPVEKEQADSSRKHIPDTDGDIPPWAPCKRGPFYVPDESTKTSVSLLLGEPSKKRRKGALSRITSMKAKIQSHYLEPWRFRLSNRKALKPWKFEVKKRNRRKSFVTRRLAGNY